MEKTKGKNLIYLVDGSNVARFNPTKEKKGKFSNIMQLHKQLENLLKIHRIKFQTIIDASLKSNIDNVKGLENAINTGKIIQTPSGTEADYFFLEYFKRHRDNVVIISNDTFKDHHIAMINQCKFAFIMDELILKPTLEYFLETSANKKAGGKVNA